MPGVGGRGVGKHIIKTNKGNLEKLETLLLGRNKIKVLEKGLYDGHVKVLHGLFTSNISEFIKNYLRRTSI